MTDGYDRRRYFRLRYPGDVRPVARIDGVEWALVEVSVRGVRVAATAGELTMRQSCHIELVLPNVGAVVVEEGVVLRADGGECVLWLNEEIDHAIIFREQRRLIRRARKMRDSDALDLMRTRARFALGQRR